jgi:general stress protein YciG
VLKTFHSLGEKALKTGLMGLVHYFRCIRCKPIDLSTLNHYIMATNSGKAEEGKSPGSKGGKGTSSRGFASMDPEQQRAIARKGGEAISSNREHMSQIGRKGGEASGGGKGTSR